MSVYWHNVLYLLLLRDQKMVEIPKHFVELNSSVWIIISQCCWWTFFILFVLSSQCFYQNVFYIGTYFSVDKCNFHWRKSFRVSFSRRKSRLIIVCNVYGISRLCVYIGLSLSTGCQSFVVDQHMYYASLLKFILLISCSL